VNKLTLGIKLIFHLNSPSYVRKVFMNLSKESGMLKLKEPRQLMFGKIKSATLDVSFGAGQKIKVEFIKKRRKNFY
jgi:hypothetical protein